MAIGEYEECIGDRGGTASGVRDCVGGESIEGC